MGGMWFEPEILGDSLSETAGYKSGLALSIEEMCDHLVDTGYADILSSSETQTVRIRSENYDELFYKLLYKIGYTKEEYNGDALGIGLFHKYRGTKLESVHEGILELFNKIWPSLIQKTIESGTKSLDPTPYLRAVFDKYGKVGVNLAIEKLDALDQGMRMSPHSGMRYTNWSNIEELNSLFSGGAGKPEEGEFIDQRFINYLYANQDKLEKMHWRKFEELTAEYFHRHGFIVELGPGSNDDGVDVRVWKNSQDENNDPPHIIIQCKRQKKKIEKIVIKGLHADMNFFKADVGLVVTTSELSPGAKKTISARSYAINEIDNSGVRKWLAALQVPGTGIVRV